MTICVSRREFLNGLGSLAAATAISPMPGHTSLHPTMKSPFRIAVINDEITQDFGRACEVASKEFAMDWIELRGMWNKNVLKLDAKQIEEPQRIIWKYQFRVTNIPTPLFTTSSPAPTHS